MKKALTYLMAVLLFLIVVVGGLFVYSAYVEKPGLSYAPMPFPITATKIYPGGVATATATRCNDSTHNLLYTSTRQIRRENSTVPPLVLESVVITIAPGCSTVQTRINVVPEETKPGFYRFSGIAIFKGLLFDHEVPWNTDVFEVVARPGKEIP